MSNQEDKDDKNKNKDGDKSRHRGDSRNSKQDTELQRTEFVADDESNDIESDDYETELPASDVDEGVDNSDEDDDDVKPPHLSHEEIELRSPPRKRSRKSSHPKALQKLAFHGYYNDSSSSMSSLGTEYSDTRTSSVYRELGKLEVLGLYDSVDTKENLEPCSVIHKSEDDLYGDSNSVDSSDEEHVTTVMSATSGEMQEIQVAIMRDGGQEGSVIIDPETGQVEYTVS